MRKSHEAPRFPQSACLFKFCLEALQVVRGARIHDQEVGNLLGYNPSDTSHWKRGKKAVRNIHALEKLALTIGVSAELIQDIADGLLQFEDAWFEFEEIIEARKLQAIMTPELRMERQKRLQALEAVADNLLTTSRISSLPVFLPELIDLFPYIKVLSGDVTDRIARSVKGKPGSFQIKHRKGEMNAHTRAAIARELARIVLLCDRDKLGLPPRVETFESCEIVALSNALLVPKSLLRTEVRKQQVRIDLIGALSETFWVPRSAIRSRLKDVVLENLTERQILSEPLSVRNIEGAERRVAYWSQRAEAAHEALAEEGTNPAISDGPGSAAPTQPLH